MPNITTGAADRCQVSLLQDDTVFAEESCDSPVRGMYRHAFLLLLTMKGRPSLPSSAKWHLMNPKKKIIFGE